MEQRDSESQDKFVNTFHFWVSLLLLLLFLVVHLGQSHRVPVYVR